MCVSSEAGPSTLGSMLMPVQETEWEELIRKGHMTPFGTRIPQKEAKKEPRKIMLAENSAFDQYLSDQAKLATERKKGPSLKKKKSSGLRPDKKDSVKTQKKLSPKDKKLKKRMRKLQITALKAHPKARPKNEPHPPKLKRKHRTDGEETESDGSEYLPSDEVIDPDEEERQAMEEGFGEEGDDEEYELKLFNRRKTDGRARKNAKTKQDSEEEYCPESSGEEEEEGKGKLKKFKDDGDVEYYRQRIRYYSIIFIHSLLEKMFWFRSYLWMRRCKKVFHCVATVINGKPQIKPWTPHVICISNAANVLLLFPFCLQSYSVAPTVQKTS